MTDTITVTGNIATPPEHKRTSAELFDLSCGGFKRGFAARDEADVRALASECSRRRTTYIGRCAGNHHDCPMTLTMHD